MTSDSHLFHGREQLEADGLRLDGNIFRKDGVEYLPLYEGKLTDSFNHRFATFDGVKAEDVQKGNPREASSSSELSSAGFVPIPRSWVSTTDVQRASAGSQSFFLSFHRVANPNNERSALFALLPKTGVADSLFLIEGLSAVDATSICAVGNSHVLDFLVRQKVGSRNFSFFIAKQIAVPPPIALNNRAPWLDGTLSLQNWLLTRVLELSYTAWDLEPLAQDCRCSCPPFRWEEERRFLLRCELDAALFHLYLPADKSGDWCRAESETAKDLARLTQSFATPRDAVAYIMDTFPIVCRNDEERHGEYRTKRVVLDIYDALQNAVHTGKPYQTRLDPPPADPRVTHLSPGMKRAPGEPYELPDLLSVDLMGETAPVRLPASEGRAGPRMFRFLSASDALPEKEKIVIIRHSLLRIGGAASLVAAGKFQWTEQQDVETGKPIFAVTLRGFGESARLCLTEDEWLDFRPLAVLVE